MKKLFIIGVLILSGGFAFAQDLITPEQYVAMYKDIAIREMKRMGVPAAITLAQGILETESGNSDLVKKSNNHFGIKCKSNWTGESVSHDDDAAGECFRLYKTAEDSYRDHSNFLRGNTRYGFLFKLDVKDYKGWAYGLKKAGYATNPSYPQILIKHIEQYNLQQYTLLGADEVPKYDASKYEDDKEDEPVGKTVIVNEKKPDGNYYA
ncbi:MAG: glucosaminidase domain-containing protein [Ferruginibacter sp.]